MNSYRNTTMYKIICKDESVRDIYVGHTTNFQKRIRSHRSRCYNPHEKCYNLPLYKFMRANGGFDNFQLVVIEQCCFNSKQEATTHEGYLVNILEASLNSRMPGRSSKQWYEQNKEHVLARQQQNQETQAKRGQPFQCPHCKCWIRWNEKSRHNKTIKHTQAVEAAMLAGL